MKPLVLISKRWNGGLRYARYVGRESTHIVDAEEALSPREIETFRTEPASIVPPHDEESA